MSSSEDNWRRKNLILLYLPEYLRIKLSNIVTYENIVMLILPCFDFIFLLVLIRKEISMYSIPTYKAII